MDTIETIYVDNLSFEFQFLAIKTTKSKNHRMSIYYFFDFLMSNFKR